MDAPACAVGRLEAEGAWIGFAPSLDDAYALVVGEEDRTWRATAEPRDLVALAIVYFADDLPEPPEDLAATHGDIGALVRHAALATASPDERHAFAEAVDAIDDGLAADEVIARLGRIFGDGVNAAAHLRARARGLVGTG